MTLSPTLYKKSSFVLAFLIFLFTSCKVHFVADYNIEMAKQIDATSKMVDNFYLTMLEKTKSDSAGRAYVNFTDKYIDIEVELNSLLNKNKVRPLNQNSIRIAEIALQIWNKYKEEHKKDNTLSNGLIKLNMKYMNDLLFAMLIAEQGKKIAASTPTNP
jgi:hypothetical protein